MKLVEFSLLCRFAFFVFLFQLFVTNFFGPSVGLGQERERFRFDGKVRDGEGRSVDAAKIYGYYLDPKGGRFEAVADANGTFSVMREQRPAAVMVFSKDKNLIGIKTIEPNEEQMAISIHPKATVTGQLVDEKTGKPFADQAITYGVQYEKQQGSHLTLASTETATDETGFFELDKVYVGGDITISLVQTRDDEGRARSFRFVKSFKMSEDAEMDLGRISLSVPYSPPSLDEKIVRVFVDRPFVDGPLKDRVDLESNLARLAIQHLVIVSGSRANSRLQEFFDLLFNNDMIKSLASDFRIIALDPDGTFDAETKKKLDVSEPAGGFAIDVFDAAGSKLASVTAKELVRDGVLSADLLSKFLSDYRPSPRNANTLLDAALKQAKKENKNVFIVETSSKSSACRSLLQFLDQNRIWDKDFVLVQMDQRWEGAKELMEDFRGERDGGLPWCIILGANGEKLAISNLENGGRRNIRFPNSRADRAHFKKMLMASKIRMTKDEIDQMMLEFGSN